MEPRARALVYVCISTIILTAATGVAAGEAVDCGEVEFDGGDGEETPYEISTVEQLQCVQEEHKADYVLVDDVDASETAEWNDGMGFEPIGGDYEAGEPVLEGSFDGAGYTVSNLSIHRPDEHYVGLFSATASSAEIFDISVEDVDVEGLRFVGAVVGFNDGEVNLSSSSGEVRGHDVVGGLVGANDGDDLSYSRSSADVEGVREVGGLAGQNFGGTIRRSHASGDVHGEDIAGGFVGDNLGWIEDSYATGDVRADTAVGGFVGQNIYAFSDDFFRGEVKNSYSTGEVTGQEDDTTGGLVGVNELRFETVDITESADVEDSYWDVETSGQEASDGGTGLTTEEMTGEAAKENMDGFDFDDVWRTTDGYPEIRQPEVEREEDEGLPGLGFAAAAAALLLTLAVRSYRV